MLFQSKLEFRGSSERKDDKGNTYRFVNLEDEFGESCKFIVDSNSVFDLSKFKKGDLVMATLNYSSKYGSFKVLDLNLLKEVINNVK